MDGCQHNTNNLSVEQLQKQLNDAKKLAEQLQTQLNDAKLNKYKTDIQQHLDIIPIIYRNAAIEFEKQSQSIITMASAHIVHDPKNTKLEVNGYGSEFISSYNPDKYVNRNTYVITDKIIDAGIRKESDNACKKIADILKQLGFDRVKDGKTKMKEYNPNCNWNWAHKCEITLK